MSFAPPINAERHWILALILQVGIRIRFYLDQWLGLKTFFCGIARKPSPFRPKDVPVLDYVTQLGFMLLWFTGGLAREVPLIYAILAKVGILHLFNLFHNYLCARTTEQFKNAPVHREIPIPEYDWKNGSPEEFYENFCKNPHPCVLRGFMKDKDLLKELKWDKVLSTYGEEDVFLTSKELDGYPGKLKEVDNPKIYLHNSEKLFNKYPDIKKLFQYSRLEPYLRMKCGYEQLFVGRQGTGSPLHNASNWNMFYMVDGSKTWWFVDPYDTYLGYPLALLGRAAGFLFCLWPNQYNEEAFPLFKFCPTYKTTINSGDVLLNPPWWWHSIKNVTETTVGVASRWHTDGIVGDKLVMTEEDYDIYRFGSLCFFSGLQSIPFLHGILQTPSPRYDEHLSLRETKNRYVHRQLKVHEDGGMEIMGVVTKF